MSNSLFFESSFGRNKERPQTTQGVKAVAIKNENGTSALASGKRAPAFWNH